VARIERYCLVCFFACRQCGKDGEKKDQWLHNCIYKECGLLK
jgi:hypothetical protein